mmetsp:Transcript_12767/g.36233  ORF Transcript_12767/g.36233 Transcript_12767/m.36233 type:complete len:646 (+) Transcript_12767:21-1958(+)
MGEQDRYRYVFGVGGTRGDFQPYLSLGVHLAGRGHTVKFFTALNHCNTARLFNIDAECVGGDVSEGLHNENAMRAMEQGDFAKILIGDPDKEDTGPEMVNGETIEELKQKAKGIFESFQPHCYITNMLGHLGEFEEELAKNKIVRVHIGLQQQAGPPSNQFRSIFWEREFPEPDTPLICSHIWPIQNMARQAHSYMQMMLMSGQMDKEAILDNCTGPELIFKERFDAANLPTHHILAYSPNVFPPPDDWPDLSAESSSTKIVGNLKFTRAQQDELSKAGNTFFATGEAHEGCKEFLRSGPPPVYIGWGSMIVYGSVHMTRLAVGALKVAGQRGIIVSGWAGLSFESLEGDEPGNEELRDYASEHVLFMKSAPHEWLFPQCSCCVHHGGVGTMQASLAGGSPTIITPVFADQESNAQALERGGWGAKTSKLGVLKVQELGEAIAKVCSDPGYKERAAELFKRMEREDGISRATEILERAVREELFTGKYEERQIREKAELRQLREKQLMQTTDMVLAKWNAELNKRYPAWAEFNKRNMRFAVSCQDALNSGRLWCVAASSILAREGQDLKSKEAGRYKKYAFLEQVEKKGSRLRVKKLRGFGPDEGWVTPTASGKDILENITEMARISELQADMYNKLFADIMQQK